jgi:hypothetical protein
MSWWDVGKEQLTIGDVPADRIGGGLKRIAAAHGRPSLPRLLSSLGRILDTKVVSRTPHGQVAADGSEDPALDREIRSTVDSVMEAYRDELKRGPSTEEILACFAFVLGFEPERYLSQLDGSEIEDVVTVPN